MRAGGENPDVVGILVNRKAVDSGEKREFLFRISEQLYLGRDVYFRFRPCFDGDGACRSTDDGQTAAVSEAPYFVTTRRAFERGRLIDNGRSLFILLLRRNYLWRKRQEKRAQEKCVCSLREAQKEMFLKIVHLNDLKRTDADALFREITQESEEASASNAR